MPSAVAAGSSRLTSTTGSPPASSAAVVPATARCSASRVRSGVSGQQRRGRLAGDDRLSAVEQQIAELVMIGLVREVATDQGRGVDVEQPVLSKRIVAAQVRLGWLLRRCYQGHDGRS